MYGMELQIGGPAGSGVWQQQFSGEIGKRCLVQEMDIGAGWEETLGLVLWCED
jgi:hypothetical protein